MQPSRLYCNLHFTSIYNLQFTLQYSIQPSRLYCNLHFTLICNPQFTLHCSIQLAWLYCNSHFTTIYNNHDSIATHTWRQYITATSVSLQHASTQYYTMLQVSVAGKLCIIHHVLEHVLAF